MKNMTIMGKKYFVVVLLLVWVLSMVYMVLNLGHSTGLGQSVAMDNILLELNKVKEENNKLFIQIQSFSRIEERRNSDYLNVINAAVEPSKEHEVLRRMVSTDVRETWYYLRHQLNSLKMSSYDRIITWKRIDDILKDVFEYYSATSNDLDLLASADKTDQWRLRESRMLSKVVQVVLEKTQNPPNCLESHLLLCDLNKACGFGCQVHHAIFCLITSVATNRTLVIDSRGWDYLPSGWLKYFLPPSRTCSMNHASGIVRWMEHNNKSRVVALPIIDLISPIPESMPPAIPRQISDRLIRLHGEPFAWWAGQMAGYLFRPQPYLEKMIAENMMKLNFFSGRGVVGVHIRRTDKVESEAAFHSLDEYMTHVERYFDRVDLGRSEPLNRAIYMASDDPEVFAEAASKYPEYIIYGNKEFSETASLSSRYSEGSLRAIIMDIHFLSLCDHLVCTFSSQVCRLAYELMQTMHGDASSRFVSLDDIYYFGGQFGHNQVARLNHVARNEHQMNLLKGDIIHVDGNHWNGLSKGSSKYDKGLYPSFKVLESLMLADFPVFNDYLSNLTLDSAPGNL